MKREAFVLLVFGVFIILFLLNNVFVIAISSPAVCIEGTYYSENNCLTKCVEGIKNQLICCNSNEKLVLNPDNINNEFGGYLCQSEGGIHYISGITCTPNSLDCDSQYKNVVKCSPEGDNKNLYENCSYGCKLYGTGAKCNELKTEGDLSIPIIFLGLCIIIGFIIFAIALRRNRK